MTVLLGLGGCSERYGCMTGWDGFAAGCGTWLGLWAWKVDSFTDALLLLYLIYIPSVRWEDAGVFLGGLVSAGNAVDVCMSFFLLMMSLLNN